jgi:hypothetical protein
MAIIALMTVAIATVDALGLHMLYQERQQEAQLTGGGAASKCRCGSSSSRANYQRAVHRLQGGQGLARA